MDGARRREPALAWLAGLQAPTAASASARVRPLPCWPTGLALLAWSTDRIRFRSQIEQATGWILAARGKPQPRSQQMGHDSTLVGWPWVMGTHSWIEPTAWNVLALKAAGRAQSSAHSRSRAAARRSAASRRRLQLRQHDRAGPELAAALAAHGPRPAGPGRRSGRRAAHCTFRWSISSANFRRERPRIVVLWPDRPGGAWPATPPRPATGWPSSAATNAPDWRMALVALAALGPRCPLVHPSATQT